MKRRNLDEILDYERCKKRTEKSRYFTEKFFEKYPTKYRELLEDYELVDFLQNTVCKYINKYKKEDYVVIYNLELKNERIEKEYNVITDIIEEIEEDLEDYKNSKFKDSYKDDIEQLEKDLEIFPNIEDMIPIYGESGVYYIYFNKITGGIELIDLGDMDFRNKKLASNFDEFIENLYIREEEKKPYTAEDVIQARRIVESMERYAEQYDKEKKNNKNKK
jgi:hypothetical protein